MSEETPNRTPATPATRRTTPASRRTFLRGVGLGAGATVLSGAIVGAAADASQASTTAPASPPSRAPHDDPSLEGSLIAHVSDVKTGRMVLLLDGREVVVTDPSLAQSLARKAR